MKKLVALLLVLCLAFSSVAISAADEPFVINACIASEPETIDPSLISSVDGSTYTQHQFENLMKYQMVDQNPANDPNMKLTSLSPRRIGCSPGSAWWTPPPPLTTATSWTTSS